MAVEREKIHIPNSQILRISKEAFLKKKKRKKECDHYQTSVPLQNDNAGSHKAGGMLHSKPKRGGGKEA